MIKYCENVTSKNKNKGYKHSQMHWSHLRVLHKILVKFEEL